MKQLFLFLLLITTSCNGTGSQKTLKDKGVVEAYEPTDSITFPHAIHNEQQKFYLIYAKILLQENTKEELNQIKRIALKSENPSFKQLKDVNSNKDLLKQLEGE